MQHTPSNSTATVHWPSAVQFGLGVVACGGLLTTGMGLAAAGLVQYFSDPAASEEGMSLLLRSAGLLLTAALLLPSTGYALLRLVKPEHPWLKGQERFRLYLPGILLLLAFPMVLWLGNRVQDLRFASPFLLPLLHLLAIGLPVLWVLDLADRHLPLGSRQRAWGVFATGLVLSPALIMILELAALLGGVVVTIVLVSLQPSLVAELESLSRRLPALGGDPQLLLRSLAPYVARPSVLYGALVFVAGIVPLIEELLKPLGVWLLVGRPLSPAAGFAAGALSGAGYALFESLALASGGGEGWAFQTFVRSGTCIIHIATAGLTGYALALAWQENRYIRLGVAYLLSVTLHALWNGMTVFYTFSTILEQSGQPEAMPLVNRIGLAAPFALAYLALTGLVLLLIANRLLRREAPALEAQSALEPV